MNAPRGGRAGFWRGSLKIVEAPFETGVIPLTPLTPPIPRPPKPREAAGSVWELRVTKWTRGMRGDGFDPGRPSAILGRAALGPACSPGAALRNFA